MINLRISFIANLQSLIPVKIRDIVIIEYLKSVLNPLQQLNGRFAKWAYQNLYKVSMTGQVIYLEHILNDIFDPTNRAIYIDYPLIQVSDSKVIYYDIEQQPQDLAIYYVGENAPLVGLFYDGEQKLVPHFIVKVPSSILAATDISIKGIVNFYKIAGKRYTVEPF
jgi:hypothetical protein